MIQLGNSALRSRGLGLSQRSPASIDSKSDLSARTVQFGAVSASRGSELTITLPTFRETLIIRAASHDETFDRNKRCSNT